jgi:Holliday junction resolvase
MTLSPFLQDLMRRNKGEIMVRTVYVVGKPRTGKTTMVKTMAAKIKEAYGDKVFFCVTNDYRDVITQLRPDKSINIFFVDDAIRLQFSRNAQTKKNKQDAIDAAELAHIAEKKGMKEGLILVFIGSQTLTGVDYQLRAQCEIIMIKWVNLLLDKPYLELLDIDPDELAEWIKAVRRREPWALSRSLVVLPEGETGWYRFKPLECEPDLELRRSDGGIPAAAGAGEDGAAGEPPVQVTTTTDLNTALEEIIAKMKHEPKWAEAAELYRLYRAGVTLRDISARTGRPVSTISDLKRSAQAEAKRRLGEVYEQMVALRLKSQGFNVNHLGGEGEPDILAEKDGEKYVIACKVYEDAKMTVTMPIKEINPELFYARTQGKTKLLVYFYNMAWGVEIIREVDAQSPPARVTFSRQDVLAAAAAEPAAAYAASLARP